jgi:hypothetical protein
MAIAVLYVLVSPVVATPNALSKSRHGHVAVIAPVLSLFAIPLLPRQLQVLDCPYVFRSVDVIELTCTRLC